MTNQDRPLDVIGEIDGHQVTSLRILAPRGNSAKYSAELRNAAQETIAAFESEDFTVLRSSLAASAGIGLKYTDAVLASTIDFNRRFDAAQAYNNEHAGPYLVNQFFVEHVAYSVVHHPAQKFVNVDPSKDRTEPEFYRAVAWGRVLPEGETDAPLLFDDIADSLFDATVVIRNHIEKSIIKAFMPEVKL